MEGSPAPTDTRGRKVFTWQTPAPGTTCSVTSTQPQLIQLTGAQGCPTPAPVGRGELSPGPSSPGLTLTLPAATESPALHLTAPRGLGRLTGCSWQTPQLQGTGIVPSQTLWVRGVGDRHLDHQHITAVTHSGTFGMQHTAKQGTRTPTNITSKPPGSQKAKGSARLHLIFQLFHIPHSGSIWE